jgi:hypothetical protein
MCFVIRSIVLWLVQFAVFKNMEVSKGISKFRGRKGEIIHFRNQNFIQ